jgi:hypothetical protein
MHSIWYRDHANLVPCKQVLTFEHNSICVGCCIQGSTFLLQGHSKKGRPPYGFEYRRRHGNKFGNNAAVSPEICRISFMENVRDLGNKATLSNREDRKSRLISLVGMEFRESWSLGNNLLCLWENMCRWRIIITTYRSGRLLQWIFWGVTTNKLTIRFYLINILMTESTGYQSLFRISISI